MSASDLLNFDENTAGSDPVEKFLENLHDQQQHTETGSGSHSNNGLTSEYFVVDDKQSNNGADLLANVETAFGSMKEKVFAEADSSTHHDRRETEQPQPPTSTSSSSSSTSTKTSTTTVDNSKSKSSEKKSSSKSDCAICPYYALGKIRIHFF